MLIRQHPSRPLEFRHPELIAMPPTDRIASVDGPEGGEVEQHVELRAATDVVRLGPAGDSAGDATGAVEG